MHFCARAKVSEALEGTTPGTEFISWNGKESVAVKPLWEKIDHTFSHFTLIGCTQMHSFHHWQWFPAKTVNERHPEESDECIGNTLLNDNALFQAILTLLHLYLALRIVVNPYDACEPSNQLNCLTHVVWLQFFKILIYIFTEIFL